MSREENVSDSWEQYADESELEKRLEKEKVKREQVDEMSVTSQNGLALNGGDDFKPRILQRQQPKGQQNQIKILKRPESITPSSSTGNLQNSSKPQMKTLEQREKEYAEARKRILGSAETSPIDPNPMSKPMVYNKVSPSSSSNNLQNYNSQQYQFSQQQQLQQGIPNNIIRQPKGPSNINPGFRIQR
ncbi:SUZ RNA-binding domain-containing [Chironomus tepperi]|uniref:SUZ RNA-binding domain-containing n=1 Tax=Chironomus tepperi TaxID=113505 RepID=UPI00391F3607